MGTAPLAADLAAADSAAETSPAQGWPSPRLAWYAVFLFVLATMMNFFDITVFGLMIESIKRDFALSDVQLGLLLGPAGILFYVIVGIPLARLVDIYPRNIILAVGLTITSGMTALGGIVQSYGQLFASRMCVGVGGSAHAPGTYSMMADYFPPAKLPRAIAVLQLGFILGTGLASIVGGAMLGYTAGWQPIAIGPLLIRNWQWVLIATGIPGLIIAGFIFALPEPPRRGKVSEAGGLSIRATFAEIWARRGVYFPLFGGLALSAIEAQGILSWRAPFMMRTYGWTPAQIGAWGGLTIFVAMPMGVAFGTWLTERLSKRHRDAPIRTTAIVFALAIPFSALAPWMPNGELAVVMGALAAVFGLAAAVPQNAAIQRITPNEMRGQVTAVYLFMFIVFGALGSFVVSLATTYVVGGEQRLWLSMSLVAGCLLPLAVLAIMRGMKPYAREIQRLEAAGL